MKTVFSARTVAAVLFLGALTGSFPVRADDPPKELVQYIQDAQRRGIPESTIRENTSRIGWPPAIVDQAITFARKGSRPETTIANTTAGPTAVDDGGAPAGTVAAPLPSVPEDYQIGAGDTLQISVWKEPDVTVPSVVVRPDGRITVPLIKEVEVAGLTPRQAEEVITGNLSRFISDANVTVVVAAIHSKKLYVVGAVRKEGTIPYTYGMTVMQALSEAGGLTDFAKRKKIYILRTELGREYRLDFNYEEVVRGNHTEQNLVLQAGDTVVIPH